MKVEEFFTDVGKSIQEVIGQLDQTAKKLLFVTEDSKLIGTVTDGDIRRWILKKGDLSKSVKCVMNSSPIFLKENEKQKAYEVMRKESVEGIPIVNDVFEITEIIFWNDKETKTAQEQQTVDVPVVIMAGGKGTRLLPYTEIIPKPLLPVGDIPIAERIMQRFAVNGFKRFYLTMCYKKDLIRAYFTKDIPYDITLLEELEPRGTAASLKLLQNDLQGSFFVSNCDILLELDYKKLLRFHQENQYKLTLVAAIKTYEIPYGVVQLSEHGNLISFQEKPKIECLANTGLYIMESELLQYIPEKDFYDMTDLIKVCLDKGDYIGVYPTMDSCFMDMGTLNELKNMEERLRL